MPNKYKTKVKYYRKKQFMEEEKEEPQIKAERKSSSVAIQTKKNSINQN